MSKKFCLMIFSIMLFAFVTHGATLSSEITARASLSEAQDAAKSWRADSVLTHISTSRVSENGTAKEWIYEFYSPKAKIWFYVSAQGERIEGTETGFGKSDVLADMFFDSDRAMQTAKAHGLKGKTPGMSLAIYRFGGNPVAYWMVSGGYEKGDVTIFLEAKTGKFHSKNVIE